MRNLRTQGLTGIASCAIIAAAMIATVGSGDDGKDAAVKVTDSSAPSASATDQAGTSKKPAKTKSTSFALGDTVKKGDWQMKFTKFIDPLKSANEFSTPKAGNKFVSVAGTMTNISKEQKTLSSLICFSVRDAEGRKYDPAFTADDTPQLEGDVPPGDKLTGSVAFEVPRAAKGLRLYVNCDFIGSSTAIYKLS